MGGSSDAADCGAQMKSILNLLVLISLMVLSYVYIVMPTQKTVFQTPATIKVFVIDSGINLNNTIFSNKRIKCVTKNDCKDYNGHGTNMVSIILNGELDMLNQPTSPVCPEVELEMCNYNHLARSDDSYFSCLERATKAKPDIVNYSSVGSAPLLYEYLKVREMTENGTIYVVATGNDGKNLFNSHTYPTMYMHLDKIQKPIRASFIPYLGSPIKNIIPVGALNKDGTLWKDSNTVTGMVTEIGVNVRAASYAGFYQNITGTSVAAAMYTNKQLIKLCNQRSKK